MTLASERDSRAARFTSVNAGRPLFQIKPSLIALRTKWVECL